MTGHSVALAHSDCAGQLHNNEGQCKGDYRYCEEHVLFGKRERRAYGDERRQHNACFRCVGAFHGNHIAIGEFKRPAARGCPYQGCSKRENGACQTDCRTNRNKLRFHDCLISLTRPFDSFSFEEPQCPSGSKVRLRAISFRDSRH